MTNVSEKQKSFGLLLLRVAIGSFMLMHGIQKAMAFTEMSQTFPDPLGMGSQLSLISAIGAEAGCSILLILGAFTRLALLPLAFTMGVALFMIHAADEWEVKELAAVYLAVYIGLLIMGPGEFSIDAWRRNKKSGGADS
jgi:putative oxidoreductase